MRPGPDPEHSTRQTSTLPPRLTRRHLKKEHVLYTRENDDKNGQSESNYKKRTYEIDKSMPIEFAEPKTLLVVISNDRTLITLLISC